MGNHRSIRAEQELVLGAVTAVFGATAAGKSNLVDALRWMRGAVRGGGIAGARTAFRLDPLAAAEPSVFAAEVVVDGARYDYGFVVDDERVAAEWLYTYRHTRRRLVFDRMGERIKLGSTLPEYRSRGTVLSGLTSADALLLTVGARRGEAEFLPVYRWFDTGLRIGGASERDVLDLLSDGDPARTALAGLLRAADAAVTGIVVDPLDTAGALDARLGEAQRTVAVAGTALRAAREEVDRVVRTAPIPAPRGHSTAPAGSSPETRDALAAAMATYEDRGSELREAERQVGALETVRERAAATPPTILLHQGRLGATLRVDEQSTGTRHWLSLAAAALSTLDGGALLAVDEADMSVHPRLTARLVELFRDRASNPRRAQLLFTSHHQRLLDEGTLARGEAWVVEKDTDTGETRLVPLADPKEGP